MKVSVSQFKSTTDVMSNIAIIRAHVQSAAQQGARVVAFPEASMVAFESSREELLAHAKVSSELFIEAMRKIAVDFHVDVIVGMYEDNDTERTSNIFLHVNFAGKVMGRYDKVHLYDAFSFQESYKNRPAQLHANHEEVYVAEIDTMKFAVFNCYDLRFPEIARIAIDQGADVLVYGAGWISGSFKELHWDTLLRARAIENTCFVMASCQPPPESVGMSMILDPNGLTLAGVAAREGLATAEINRHRLEDVRKTLPCLAHRRYYIARH